MRKLYVFVISCLHLLSASFLLSLTATAQSNGDYRTRANGNWNATNVWQIYNSGWNNTTTAPTSSNGTVTILHNITVTANASCSSLSFYGGLSSDLTLSISSGIALNVTGTVTIPRAGGSGTTYQNTLAVGAGTLNAGSISFTDAGGNNRHQVTISTGTVKVTGNIVSDGTSGDNSATITFSGAGLLQVGGAIFSSNYGTLTTTTNSTVEYNGTTQTVGDFTYYNLTISGSGTKTISSAVTVNTTLSLAGGTLAAGNNLTMGGTGTPLITRSGGSFTGTPQTGNDYDATYTGNSKTTGTELAGTGLRNLTINLSSAQTLSLNANRTPDGTLSVAAGTFDLSTFTINRSANGGSLTVSNGAKLKIAGTNTFPTQYTTHSIGATSTVEYGGTAQTVAALNSSQAYGNLTLSGSGNKNFPAARTVNGTLSMQGTAAATGTSPTFGASSKLQYAGSSSQTSTNVEFPASSGPINLEINNGNGVILHAARTVTGVITFTNGVLTTTTSNLLTISSTGSVVDASDDSFVDGPVLKKGNSDFTFPLGRTGAGLVPIKISGLSTSSDFRAEYKRATTPSGNSITASGLYHVSHCEYWTLDRTGSATANVTLYWSPLSNCNAASYVTQLSSIVVAHFNGTSWNAYGRSGGTTGTISSGSVTWNGVSAFSPFSLGSTDPVQNPLPILLTNVIAYEKNNGVQVEWTNMTESNIENYSIERSTNGIDFTFIAKQQPKSNNSDRVDYAQLDAAPMSLNYYRIVATEANGKTISSRIMKVEKGKTNNSLLIYPNPVTNKQLNINVTNIKTGQYKLKVFNSAGLEVFTKTILSRGTVIADAIKLPQLQDGTYTILLTGENYSQSRLFIIQ